MKKAWVAVLCSFLCFLLCSCVRTGEKDSVDFLSAIIKSGFDCAVQETSSGEYLKESCYINGCKLSLYSEASGKLVRVSVTCVPDSRGEFLPLASAAVKAFCSYTDDNVSDIFSVLGINGYLPEDSMGIKQCTTEWYSFSFTCDEAGGALEVISLRLEPTSTPEVTLNTTVPFIKISSFMVMLSYTLSEKYDLSKNGNK